MRLLAYSTRLLTFLATLAYLHSLMFWESPVEMVVSESELREELLRDQLLVFGLYNSLICKKCLSYFQKLKTEFSSDPVLANYRFAFKAVDRALFMKRGQQFDFASAANMVLFYSKRRILWFHEFTRISAIYSGSKSQNSKIFTESIKYLDSQMRLLKPLVSLEETIESVNRHKTITVFVGQKDSHFSVFESVARLNFDLPLFYIDRPEVADEVAVYYLGFLPTITPMILTLRHSDRINFADLDSFSLTQFDSDPQRLLRKIVVEQSSRLSVGLQNEEFLQAVATGVPMVFYVESRNNDQLRNSKISAYFEFLKLSPKTFLSFVVPNNSPVLNTYSVLSDLLETSEDWVYLVTSSGGLSTLSVERLEGPLTGEAIQEEVERLVFAMSFDAKEEGLEEQRLSGQTLDILVAFFTGKSVSLPSLK